MKIILTKRATKWLFVLILLVITTTTNAINISSNAVTGNWSSPASWAGGVVPTKNDSAIVVSGANITVDVDTCKAYKLKVNSGGTVNVSSHILKLYGGTVTKVISSVPYTYTGNGSLTISTGGTFNLNTGTLVMTGSFGSDGTFNCGTGTVIFDTKRAIITIWGSSIPTFYNIINNDSIPGSYPLSGGFGVTLHPDNTNITGNLVINGSFNRNSSAVNDTVDITFAGNTTLSGVYSLYLNDVIINSGATLNAGSKTIYLYGNWTSNGTFACGNGTIWFSRDANNDLVQNVYQANPDLNPFYNLYTNKTAGSVLQLAGAANVNGNIYVENNFTVNRGSWDMGGMHRLYVKGNFIVNGSNGGIYTASAGRLLLTGTNVSTPQTLNTGGSSLYKLTINNSGAGILQASDVTITYELQFTNGILYTLNGSNLYECYLSNNDATLSLPSGYSSTSFIVGKFKRAVTGANTYFFPVGPTSTIPVKYRPITYQQTAANGAATLFVSESPIANTGTYNANWWAQIQPDAGTPSGSFAFKYDLTNDFPLGMSECNISAMRGVIPSPSDWNYVLTTTIAPSGASNGSITSTIPATMSPYAYILGEPVASASGTTICGGSSASLSVTAPSGWTSFNWYDAASSGNLLQAASSTYNTPTLSSSTNYYVAYANALTGCVAHTTSIAVTVTPAPTANAGSNSSVCSGSSYTLSGTSASNYNTLNWTSSGTGTFTNNGTTTPTYTPSAADISAGTVTLSLNAIGNSPCGTVKDDMTLSILTSASAPTLANTDRNNFCADDAGTINLSVTGGAGTSVAWYTGGCGTSSIGTGNPLNIASPSVTTTYYARWESSCGNSSCQSVTVTVNPLPVAPTLASVDRNNFCADDAGTINLSVTGGSGTSVAWYTSGCGTSLVGSGNPLNLASPTSTTTYYARWINSCGNSTCQSITVTVNALPVAPTLASVDRNNFCADDAGTINLSVTGGSGTSVAWYTSGCGTTSVGSGNPLNIASPTTTTTYYARWENACGNSTCQSITVSVNSLPTAPTLASVDRNNFCADDAGTINLSVTGGSGTSVAWYIGGCGTTLAGTGNPLNIASPTGTTTYYARWENTCGSTLCMNTTVTVNPIPVAPTAANSDRTNFCADDAGTINLTVIGGSGTNVSWYTSGCGTTAIGSGNPLNIASPSVTTTYYARWENSCGYSSCQSTTVAVNQLPNVNAGTDVSIPTGTSTSLSATASSSSGSYSISWSPSSYLNNPNSLTPTTTNLNSTTVFTLTITDNTTGCQQTDQVMVTVTGGVLSTSASSTPSTICQGQNVQLFALASGGSGSYTYSWTSNPVGFTSSDMDPIVTPTANTVYLLSVYDGFSTVTSNTSVTVNPTPTAFAGNNDSICLGAGTYLNASGGSSYSWSPSTGLSSSTIAAPYANPTTNTTYIVTVSNTYGCSATDDVNIVVNPVPMATVSSDLSLCLGNSASLSASGGTQYNWSPALGLSGINVPNPTASPTSTTIYTVVVSNTQGCTDNASVTVTVNPLPNANAGSDQSICSGNSASISASGGQYYSWSPSGGLSDASISNPVAAPLTSTTYLLTVTDNNGCSNTDDILITVNENPIANAGADTALCSGSSVSLNATGGDTYQWYPSTGLSNANIANPSANPSSSTSYTLTVSNSNGCSESDDIILTVNPTPTADAGSDQIICDGNAAIITASGGGNYLWSTGDTTSVITPFPNSNMSYTVTVTNGSSCSATDMVNITVTPIPDISIAFENENNIIYAGQTVVLTATPSQYPEYTFYTDTVLSQSGNLNTFEITGDNGEHTIYVIASENGCNSATDSVSFIVKPIPNAFTPNNNDGVNDIFLKGLQLSVFNRWGQELYSGKDGWDGKYNGKYVSAGTYFFKIELKDTNDVITEIKGSVSLIE